MLFECVVAKLYWGLMSDILGYQVGEYMVVIGKFWISNKKYCILNMITSTIIWSIWKHRNDICFQNIGWRSMEMLLYRIIGLLLNWTALWPEDKQGSLMEYINKIKIVVGRVFWLPNVPQSPS